MKNLRNIALTGVLALGVAACASDQTAQRYYATFRGFPTIVEDTDSTSRVTMMSPGVGDYMYDPHILLAIDNGKDGFDQIFVDGELLESRKPFEAMGKKYPPTPFDGLVDSLTFVYETVKATGSRTN